MTFRRGGPLRRSCSAARATTSTRTTASRRSIVSGSSPRAPTIPKGSRHQRADLLLPRHAALVHRRRGHRPAEPAPGLGHLRAARQSDRQPPREEDRQADADVPGLDRQRRELRLRVPDRRTRASRPTSATRRAGTATGSSSCGSRRSTGRRSGTASSTSASRPPAGSSCNTTTCTSPRRARRPRACGSTPDRSRPRTPRAVVAVRRTRPVRRWLTRCTRSSSSRRAARSRPRTRSRRRRAGSTCRA